MRLPENKPLRSFGVYTLRDKTLILLKRSENLSFLFTPKHWNLHGMVDYRVSHGQIYQRGRATAWFDEDLVDTGMTASAPNLSVLLKKRNH